MTETWFISDHHLQHKRFLEMVDKHNCLVRPEFENIDHMNEFIIEAHNEVVAENDIVWFLGDVVWKDNLESIELLKRFNGKLNLTPGNHDDVVFLLNTGLFRECVLWKKFELGDKKFLASHVPLAHNDILTRCDYNIHGHTHEVCVLDDKGHDDPRYINVSVEQTGYYPVNMDQIKFLAEPY